MFPQVSTYSSCLGLWSPSTKLWPRHRSLFCGAEAAKQKAKAEAQQKAAELSRKKAAKFTCDWLRGHKSGFGGTAREVLLYADGLESMGRGVQGRTIVAQSLIPSLHPAESS